MTTSDYINLAEATQLIEQASEVLLKASIEIREILLEIEAKMKIVDHLADVAKSLKSPEDQEGLKRLKSALQKMRASA